MFQKVLVLYCVITAVSAQEDCSQYWKYIKENGVTEGQISMPPGVASDHKLRVKIWVMGQISSVSELYYFYIYFRSFKL